MEVGTKFSTFALEKELLIWDQKKNLLSDLKKKPKDFTYEETVSLLAHFDKGGNGLWII